MGVINDYYCPECETEAYNISSDDPPACCGVQMRVDMSALRIYTPEWSGPRVIPSIRDEAFASRSEFEDYKTKNGLRTAPSADKEGGARNEEHLHLGKLYSYKGSPKRGNPNPTNH